MHYESSDYLVFSDNLLFILGGMGNQPKEKFTQIVKQSIPEKDPIIYSETLENISIKIKQFKI